MRLSRQLVARRARGVICAGIVTGCLTVGARASPGQSLKLLDGHPGAAGKSCGVAPHWAYYRVGGIVRYVGHAGRSAKSIKLVIWRCYASGFRIAETLPPVHVNSTGGFKGSFAVNVHSDCFAQASSAGWHSNRAYFRVR